MGLKEMVGPNGLEPSTSSVSGRRSNQLSYGPTQLKRLPPFPEREHREIKFASN